jgi:hypothetical protein
MSFFVVFVYLVSMIICSIQESLSSNTSEITYIEVYKKLLPCIENSIFAHKSSKWAYPIDAREHYQHLLHETRMYRNIKIHESGNTRYWIENNFIDHFMDKDLSYFNGFIPLFIQWTDIHVGNFSKHIYKRKEYKNVFILNHQEMLKNISLLLRPDVLYLAVSQDDQGK